MCYLTIDFSSPMFLTKRQLELSLSSFPFNDGLLTGYEPSSFPIIQPNRLLTFASRRGLESYDVVTVLCYEAR